MDFVSAHDGAIPDTAMRSPGQFDHPLVRRAKLEISAACHAYGKVPSHNVSTEVRDMSVVANDAARARNEFGYTRMWSIHPAQIEAIVARLLRATKKSSPLPKFCWLRSPRNGDRRAITTRCTTGQLSLLLVGAASRAIHWPRRPQDARRSSRKWALTGKPHHEHDG
jgi:Citrate lyase beta subunit